MLKHFLNCGVGLAIGYSRLVLVLPLTFLVSACASSMVETNGAIGSGTVATGSIASLPPPQGSLTSAGPPPYCRRANANMSD